MKRHFPSEYELYEDNGLVSNPTAARFFLKNQITWAIYLLSLSDLNRSDYIRAVGISANKYLDTGLVQGWLDEDEQQNIKRSLPSLELTLEQCQCW